MPITKASSADYYLEYLDADARESAGEWIGEGAKALGLSGKVDEKAFRNLMAGLHPNTGRELILHSAIRKTLAHTSAWDFTLAGPKAFGLLLAFPEFHEKLMRILQSALGTVVGDWQENAAFTRRGHGGARIEKCKLVVLAFFHFASRRGDPHPHVHAIIANTAPRISDNTFGTILSKPLYDRQTTSQLIFNAALATGLKKEFNIPVTPGETPGSFEIPGIPPELIKIFSSRRIEILSKLKEWGADGPRAAEMATLTTRPAKVNMRLSDRRALWREITERYGYDLVQIKADILSPGKRLADVTQPVSEEQVIAADEDSRQRRDDPNGTDTAGELVKEQKPLSSEQRESKDAVGRADSQEAGGQRKVDGVGSPQSVDALRDFIATKEFNSQKRDQDATKGPAGRDQPSESVAPNTEGIGVPEPKAGTAAKPDANQKANQSTKTGPTNSDDFAERSESKGADPDARSREKQQANSEGFDLRERRIKAAILSAVARSAIAADLPSSFQDKLIDRVVDDYDRKVRRAIEKNSPAIARAEAEKALPGLLANADQMAKDFRHTISADSIKQGVTGKLSSRENDSALLDVLAKKGSVACVDGAHGVNASFFVAAVAREYAKAGFNVRTFTSSSTGASALETIVKKDVLSTRQLVLRLKTSVLEVGGHHFHQMMRAALGKSAFERIQFDSKTVVVIADAHLLKTKDAARIIGEANAAHSKVVLVGSSTQSPTREPHNAFAEISNRVGKVTLCDSAIQSEKWMKAAVAQAKIGDTRGALSEYLLADRLHLAPDHKSAMKELVNHWKKLPRKEQNGNTLVIAGSARDSHAMNKMMQRSRLLSGNLGLFLRQKIGDGSKVRGGDRILFHVGSKHYGFRGGDLGTIIRITPKGLRVKLDRTRLALFGKPAIRVDVPRALLKGVSLGYAVTATEAQDMAHDKTLILQKAGGGDVSTFLTQISRAQKDSRIFSTTASVGEDVENLKRSLEKQNQEIRNQQASEERQHKQTKESASGSGAETRGPEIVRKQGIKI